MTFWSLFKLGTSNKKQGFTLLELIAASIMTIFVVTAAGFGTIVMLREQAASDASGDIQFQLNRALDFMADEVKASSSIITNVSSGNLGTIAPDFNPTGKNVILVLNVSGLSQPIIYYSETGSSPWLGPRVIDRWGPAFDDNGNYSNPTTPSDWTGNVLVDSIDNSSVLMSCPNNWTSPNPSWTAPNTPSVSTTYGFYACVDPTGKVAEITAFASAAGDQKIANMVGSNPDESTRLGDKVTYSATTRAFARAKSPISITVSGGNATFYQTAEARFSTSGCVAAQLPIDVAGTATNITANGETTIIISPSSLDLTPASGTDFTVTSSSNVATFTSGTCVVTATLNTP